MVGRSVIITGAAGGIGWATATLYAKSGAKLVLADLLPFADRQIGELKKLGARDVLAHPCDVSKEREVETVCKLAYFTKHGFLRMKAGSAMVNVSSVHAVRSSPMAGSYAAAKAGMLALTRAAAIEGKPLGIRCNAVLPGAIDTPMLWNNPNIKSGAETLDTAEIGKPEEVAAAIRFLASPEASFITGASLAVDGGRLAQL
jgi:NAD(P)-dependent dehydrogenase (short-subunit alcohol dehydrogenase family)